MSHANTFRSTVATAYLAENGQPRIVCVPSDDDGSRTRYTRLAGQEVWMGETFHWHDGNEPSECWFVADDADVSLLDDVYTAPRA